MLMLLYNAESFDHFPAERSVLETFSFSLFDRKLPSLRIIAIEVGLYFRQKFII